MPIVDTVATGKIAKMVQTFINRVERNPRRCTSWLKIKPLIPVDCNERPPTPRPPLAASSTSKQKSKNQQRNCQRKKQRELAKLQRKRQLEKEKKLAEEAAKERRKQQANDARRRRYVTKCVKDRVEELKQDLTGVFQEQLEHMKENLEDLIDQKIKSAQPPAPPRRKKKKRGRVSTNRPRPTFDGRADAASPTPMETPPAPAPAPAPPVPAPAPAPPVPAPAPAPPVPAPAPTPPVQVPASTPTPAPPVPPPAPAIGVPTWATNPFLAPVPAPAPPVATSSTAIIPTRVGTPMLLPPAVTSFRSPSFGTLHSYPPQQRMPVRRQLWIPREDDHRVVDEELYEQVMRDRHKRRVKRALQRLGALDTPKRRRRDDDYDIRDL